MGQRDRGRRLLLAIRGVDSENNVTPWSDLRSFRPTCQTSPNLIYPHYYYTPDTANLPVHGDRTIAWPVFVWDTALVCDPATGHLQAPPVDYYELNVDDDIAFKTPNFQITTKGNAAAPTAANPFSGLTPGGIYYWRVRAYRGGQQIGADSVWPLRYDPATPELPFASEPTPIYPADGFEAVEAPPCSAGCRLPGRTAIASRWRATPRSTKSLTKRSRNS